MQMENPISVGALFPFSGFANLANLVVEEFRPKLDFFWEVILVVSHNVLSNVVSIDWVS